MNRVELKEIMSASFIDSLKNDTKAFSSFLQRQNDASVIYVLEKLGRLENDNSRFPLLDLLEHPNENVRVLSVKNLAKLGDNSLLGIFVDCAKNDVSTIVRRESISAIGRMREEKAIPFLINSLQVKDPKIVLQAIRGLLFFFDRQNVKNALEDLAEHPNELVREVISKNLQEKAPHFCDFHSTFPKFLKNVVIHADVQATLKHVPDESVHLTFTSPPYYNARDYSIYQSYQEYLDFLKNIFQQVHRVTKEGRFFILNTSPVLIPRISRSHSSKRYPIPFDIHPILVAMGWEFIDDIVWIKPEVTVKNRNAGFLQHRKPLAYKPNPVTEMIMVYRKKTDKLIDWNMKQYSWDRVRDSKILGDYETKNIWQIDPSFDKIHSAVFPLELCRRVVAFYSFVGDLVFDPFAGSGTLGEAALKLKRNFLLAEQEAKYISRIESRLQKYENLFERGCGASFLSLVDFRLRANTPTAGENL